MYGSEVYFWQSNALWMSLFDFDFPLEELILLVELYGLLAA